MIPNIYTYPVHYNRAANIGYMNIKILLVI